MEDITITNTTHVRVRYAETDKMGFVYNGQYFTYFEVGRAELFRAYDWPYSWFEENGYQLPLIESHAKYKAPAFYDDLLDIKATMKLELKPFVRFDYEVSKEGKKIAEGYTVHMFVKSDTKRPVKPPKIFQDALASFKQSV